MRKSLKVQARAEICHTKIDDPARKNDLLIFDCCLYFKAKGPLVLLSSDKNLSIECEKEGGSLLASLTFVCANQG